MNPNSSNPSLYKYRILILLVPCILLSTVCCNMDEYLCKVCTCHLMTGNVAVGSSTQTEREASQKYMAKIKMYSMHG